MAHAHFLYIYRGYIYIHQIFTFSPPLLDNHGGLQNCINKSCASLNDSSDDMQHKMTRCVYKHEKLTDIFVLRPVLRKN